MQEQGEITMQVQSNVSTMLQSIEPELTLEERIELATDSAIKLQLVRQLIEETKKELITDVTAWELSVNDSVPMLLTALNISPRYYKCRVFFHEADSREWRLCDGTIVEIHYYGKGKDKNTIPFLEGLKRALQWIPKLQRTTALEVRNIMVKYTEAVKPTWQRYKIKNREETFNLLPKNSISTNIETEITVTKKHRETGLKVTVIGKEKDRESLELQCWLMLSREVDKLYKGIEG